MPNPVSLFRFASILVFALASIVAAAQSDRHLNGELFVKSAFAHGYMHGYEEGFHVGDLDMQLGRRFRDVKQFERFKKVSGFKTEYGDRKLFDQGYRYGFTVAYADCYWGRTFRAVQLERSSPSGVVAQPRGADKAFDQAFKQGYESGKTQGLADGRTSSVPSSTGPKCDEPLQHAKGGGSERPANYCEGFESGFQLGYSDGFANQHDVDLTVAKK